MGNKTRAKVQILSKLALGYIGIRCIPLVNQPSLSYFRRWMQSHIALGIVLDQEKQKTALQRCEGIFGWSGYISPKNYLEHIHKMHANTPKALKKHQQDFAEISRCFHRLNRGFKFWMDPTIEDENRFKEVVQIEQILSSALELPLDTTNAKIIFLDNAVEALVKSAVVLEQMDQVDWVMKLPALSKKSLVFCLIRAVWLDREDWAQDLLSHKTVVEVQELAEHVLTQSIVEPGVMVKWAELFQQHGANVAAIRPGDDQAKKQLEIILHNLSKNEAVLLHKDLGSSLTTEIHVEPKKSSGRLRL